MNYDVSKDALSVRNLEFEGCREVPLDLDFSLPDYCPDIQRILKCIVQPNITSRNISGDRLNVEGTSQVKIIYLDSDSMKVRCCENSAPFSCSIDIRCTPVNSVALTSARTEYINCRAVSPRKVDIHGAFSVCAKIYGKSSQNVSSCVSGKDIQQKIETSLASTLAGMGQQQFSLSETIEPAENKPAPEMIIRADVSAVLSDCKTMPGKVVVKGEALLKILYMDDLSSGNLETMEYSVPISQIVDVPGADENCTYTITPEILSHEEQIRSENEEGANAVSSEIKMAVTVMAYQEKELGIVSDIYSTDYNLETESEILGFEKLAETINENFSSKSSVELPDANVSKIIDVWSDASSVNAFAENEKLKFKGKMNLCILAADADNVPFYIERTAPFSHEKPAPENSKEITAEITAVPTSIGYSIPNGGTVDVRIDFNISGAIYTKEKKNMITSAEADETQAPLKNKNSSLTVYYALKGEPLWEIARKYHTSANAVKQENDISEDYVPVSGMLLIPVK